MKIHDASFTSTQNSAGSKYDMMIEKIQGQIQNVNVRIQVVNEDRSLSPDERRKEIRKLNEELREHQAELGRTKAAQAAKTNNSAANTSITKTNSDSVIIDLSATALLKSENSLRILNDAGNAVHNMYTGVIPTEDEGE